MNGFCIGQLTQLEPAQRLSWSIAYTKQIPLEAGTYGLQHMPDKIGQRSSMYQNQCRSVSKLGRTLISVLKYQQFGYP